MGTARDVMHTGCDCVKETDTLARAAELMRDLHVGALPICGKDDKLHGIITDRDIVVRCVAEGADPAKTTAADMALGAPVWVEAGADTSEVLTTMIESGIRRVPVLDNHKLVGMISEADLATHLNDKQIKQFATAIYGAPPNS